MTSQGRHFEGQLRAGGQELDNPWAEAVLTQIGDEVVLAVNQREVARLPEAIITPTEQSDVYRIEGADQPLFFRPRDPTAFGEALIPPMSTAERIAAASAPPEDATLIIEPMEEPPGAEEALDEPPGAEEAIEERVDEPPTPWWKQWWVIVGALLLLLILIVAFCNNDPETGTSTTTTLSPAVTTSVPGATSATTQPVATTVPATTTTTAATTTTASATTTTTAPPTTTSVPALDPAFGPGTQIVGEDVDPGIYETGIVSGQFACYWERLAGLSGELEDITANGNVSNHDVVEIMAEDAAFDTDCDAWYILTELAEPMTSVPEGKWVLGAHINPGTYEAPGGDACYWERLSGVSGTLDDVIANDLPSGRAVIEIDPGDFAFNSTGCGQWAPA